MWATNENSDLASRAGIHLVKTALYSPCTCSDPWAGVAGGMAPPQQQTNDWGAGADVSSIIKHTFQSFVCLMFDCVNAAVVCACVHHVSWH